MDVGQAGNHHLEPATNRYPQTRHTAAPVRSDMIASIHSSPHNIGRHEQGRLLQRLVLDMQNAHTLPFIQPTVRPWGELLVSVASLTGRLADTNRGAITAAQRGRITMDSHRHTVSTDSHGRLNINNNHAQQSLPALLTTAQVHESAHHFACDGRGTRLAPRHRHSRSALQIPGNRASTTARPLNKTLDFNLATIRNGNQQGVVSANAGATVNALGESWHVKPASDRMLATREVAAASIYGLFTHAPAYFLAENCPLPDSAAVGNQLCVASTLENYQDFGDFLMHADSADALARHFPDYPPQNVQAFKANAEQIKNIDMNLQELRRQHPMDWWRSETNAPLPQLIAQYRPQAELLDALMTAQFALLPAPLRREIQTHLVTSQLVNDWDPLNAFYRNMGIVNQNHQLHVMRLDFDSSLDVGFRGLPKANSFDIAVNQRPAVFPMLRHRFEQQHAQFSETLPLLGEEMHNFPYADYAYGSTENAASAAAIRMETAYRCVLMQQRQPYPVAQIMEQVVVDDTENMRGFQSGPALLQTMNARIDRLIEQVGGIDQIQHWARTNTLRAALVERHLDASIRQLHKA
jgi:hypothetical protein